MISIAIIEDIDDIRIPLQGFLKSQENFLCDIASVSAEEFLETVKDEEIKPDVILLDIGLPGMSGLHAIREIKRILPDTEIIMLTVYEEAGKIFDALRAGATGYLVKNSSLREIKSAIEEIVGGGSPMSPSIARKVIEFFGANKKIKPEYHLTEKERRVVYGIVEGKTYKEIAEELGNAPETIKHHAKNIYRKLHVSGKAEVVAKYMRGEI